MVDPRAGEKKQSPDYSLDAIRRLASFGQIEYRGKKVPRDVATLGMDLNEVCLCLQTLQEHQFAHSIRYDNFLRWHDVYKMRYQTRDDRSLDLYIKLRLDRECVVIELCSFHE
ncbi:MAG: type II toxin-antitoxin system MqsR family toxin [Xanthomonadales bacterium]|nr:type II toxin-antitoxin system MqsR family toxin [Xanthomonadales bacterium]